MKLPERELVILLDEDNYDDVALERQTTGLHHLLDQIETLENIIQAVEYLNLHRGGVSNNRLRIEMALRSRKPGPFQFIIHKN